MIAVFFFVNDVRDAELLKIIPVIFVQVDFTALGRSDSDLQMLLLGEIPRIAVRNRVNIKAHIL